MVSLYPSLQQYNKKVKTGSFPGNILNNRGNFHYPDTSYKEAPRYACLPGVLTLEAAVISVYLLYFFVSILFFFRVMQVQLEVHSVLDQTARKASVYMAKQEDGNQWGNKAAVKALFLKEAAAYTTMQRYISGGIAGISLANSDIMGDDVDLQAVYYVRLPFRLFGLEDFRLVSRSNARKWTGWNNTKSNQDKYNVWVYITESGNVYHRSKECTHLTLSIKSVAKETLSKLRNENGGKYHACELCAGVKNKWDKVYITNQGLSYHYDLNCRGLKRTILKIPLSEAGDRSLCRRCGVQ